MNEPEETGPDTIGPVVHEICRRFTRNTAPVTDHSRLGEDLGFDSLRRLELAVVLENYFDLGELDMDRTMSIVTVGDIVDLISSASSPGGRV
jgi:acyl carrier protein